MNIFQEAKSIIDDEYRSGMVQDEIAKRHNVTQKHISLLLSGKSSFEKMDLETFVRMFPRATINLSGDSPTVTAHQNSGNMVGVNHGTINGDCISAVIDKILDDPELTAEEKVKFVKAVKR